MGLQWSFYCRFWSWGDITSLKCKICRKCTAQLRLELRLDRIIYVAKFLRALCCMFMAKLMSTNQMCIAMLKLENYMIGLQKIPNGLVVGVWIYPDWIRNSHLMCSIKSSCEFCTIHRKTTARISFLIPQAWNFIKKETLTQVFSCEFYEICKSTFYTEHFWVTVSMTEYS